MSSRICYKGKRRKPRKKETDLRERKEDTREGGQRM